MYVCENYTKLRKTSGVKGIFRQTNIIQNTIQAILKFHECSESRDVLGHAKYLHIIVNHCTAGF